MKVTRLQRYTVAWVLLAAVICCLSARAWTLRVWSEPEVKCYSSDAGDWCETNCVVKLQIIEPNTNRWVIETRTNLGAGDTWTWCMSYATGNQAVSFYTSASAPVGQFPTNMFFRARLLP